MTASLVRTGRRMSDMMMDAPWSVAHVERPSGSRTDARSTGRLSEGFKLAEQLGGRPVTISGDDVVRAVLDHAHRNTSPRSSSARRAAVGSPNGPAGAGDRTAAQGAGRRRPHRDRGRSYRAGTGHQIGRAGGAGLARLSGGRGFRSGRNRRGSGAGCAVRAGGPGRHLSGRRGGGGGAERAAARAGGGDTGLPDLQLPVPSAALQLPDRLADRCADPGSVLERGAGYGRPGGESARTGQGGPASRRRGFGPAGRQPDPVGGPGPRRHGPHPGRTGLGRRRRRGRWCCCPRATT